MRGVQCRSDLLDDADRALRAHRTLIAQDLAQIGAGHQPHIDEQHAVDRAPVVDRDDVRFGQPGGRLRFATEAHLVGGVPGDFLRQQFDRDHAVLHRVVRLVDLAHTSFAEQGSELIRPEPATDSPSRSVQPFILHIPGKIAHHQLRYARSGRPSTRGLCWCDHAVVKRKHDRGGRSRNSILPNMSDMALEGDFRHTEIVCDLGIRRWRDNTSVRRCGGTESTKIDAGHGHQPQVPAVVGPRGSHGHRIHRQQVSRPARRSSIWRPSPLDTR